MSAPPLLLAIGLAAAGATEVRVGADVPCIDARHLEQTLKARLGKTQGRVSVERDGPALVITLQRPGAPVMVRRLTFRPDDCGELEQTVALIAAAWWKSAVQLPVGPPHNVPAPTPAPTSHGVAGSEPAPTAMATTEIHRPVRAVSAPVDAGTSPLAEPVAAGAPPVAQLEPEALHPAPAVTARIGVAASAALPTDAAPAAAPAPPASETPVAAPPVTPGPSKWTVAVALRGEGTFDGDVAVGGGALAVDAGRRDGLGAGLDLGVESSRGATLGNGSISAWLSYASLLARYRLGFPRAGLLFGLGARLFIISASASGFINSSSAVLLSPAGVATLELQWRIAGGLIITASLQGFARFQKESLTIHGLAGDKEIGQVGGTLSLGVGWIF